MPQGKGRHGGSKPGRCQGIFAGVPLAHCCQGIMEGAIVKEGKEQKVHRELGKYVNARIGS